MSGPFPELSSDPGALLVLTATGITQANGSFPLNSAGDPLPPALMFNKKYVLQSARSHAVAESLGLLAVYCTKGRTCLEDDLLAPTAKP